MIEKNYIIVALSFIALNAFAIGDERTKKGNECDSQCEKSLPGKKVNYISSLTADPSEGQISVLMDEQSQEMMFQLNSEQNGADFSIKVFNILGETVMAKQLSTEMTNVSVRSLDPGLYFITLFYNEKPQETIRVVRN